MHLKVGSKHYFTCIKEISIHEHPVFEIKNETILLVEGPLFPNATNILEKLEVALLQKYQISLKTFFKNFAMVTDSAALVAKIAHASESLELHTPDETWMSCLAHFLNNAINSAIASSNHDAYLCRVCAF